jgi:hypothetical protein
MLYQEISGNPDGKWNGYGTAELSCKKQFLTNKLFLWLYHVGFFHNNDAAASSSLAYEKFQN